ncbi:hypothetical protein MTO96_034808 [Rhipicephalus appendiculatus]
MPRILVLVPLNPGTNTAPPLSRAGIRSHPHVARDAPRGGGGSCDPKAAAPPKLDYMGSQQPTPSRRLTDHEWSWTLPEPAARFPSRIKAS